MSFGQTRLKCLLTKFDVSYGHHKTIPDTAFVHVWMYNLFSLAHFLTGIIRNSGCFPTQALRQYPPLTDVHRSHLQGGTPKTKAKMLDR